MYRLLTRLHNCVTLVVKANTFFFLQFLGHP